MIAALPKEKILLPPVRNPAEVEALSGALKIPGVIAELLIARNFRTAAQANQFFAPGDDTLHDPFLLPGMAAAVERLLRARRNNEKIFIHGDYDVDGVTATALAHRALAALGADVHFFIPNRSHEGYGLSPDGIRTLHQQGARLILTVDCGITAPAQVSLANELGIDVIITDHHLPHGTLPKAVALVNPKLPGSVYPNEHLSGAGVAFKLAQALQSGAGEIPDEWLAFAAVGLCADAVPLLGENRTLVKKGLTALSRNPSPAFRALIDVAGLTGKEINSWKVLFQLAPMINAAGRLEDASQAVSFFLNNDPVTAAATAFRLKQLNGDRKKLEQTAADACVASLDAEGAGPLPFLTLYSDGWHPGIIGIVASRLLEKYHRPALVVSLSGGVGRGSMRTVEGIDAVEALSFCGDLLENFGGHARAGGCTVKREHLPALKARLAQFAREKSPGFEAAHRVETEAEIPDLASVTPAFAQLLRRFEPFGNGNPAPVFLSRNLRVAGTPRVVGEHHLRFQVRHNNAVVDAIAFRMGERLPEIASAGDGLTLAYTIEENEWNGRRSVQLNVRGMA